MPVVQFRSSGRFGADERSLYENFNNREFHPGEIAPLEGDSLDLFIEKACCSPYPVSRATSRSCYRLTRTAAHVRAARHDVSVIRFIKRGSATLRQNRSLVTANAGDFLINRSITPATITGLPDAFGVHETILLLVPTSLLCGKQDKHEFAPAPLVGSLSGVRVAAGLMELLAEEGDKISAASARRITETLLEEIRESLLQGGGFLQAPPSLPEENFRSVCDYVALHYSDPQLSLETTSQGCHISVRYICDLFRRHDTSFAKYLWNHRLERVRDWLADENMDHHSIGALAYRAGFKSPAHLCQLFKRTYQSNPRDFRRLRPIAPIPVEHPHSDGQPLTRLHV